MNALSSLCRQHDRLLDRDHFHLHIDLGGLTHDYPLGSRTGIVTSMGAGTAMVDVSAGRWGEAN